MRFAMCLLFLSATVKALVVTRAMPHMMRSSPPSMALIDDLIKVRYAFARPPRFTHSCLDILIECTLRC